MNQHYVDYLRGEKKSENTIKSYLHAISEMESTVGKDGQNMSAADLLSWKNKVSKNSAATMCLKMSAVQSYFKFLVIMGAIEKNPAENMSRPSVKHKEKQYIEGFMVRAMIDKATNIRDKAIILLLATTGLRISEFIGLTKDQYEQAARDVDHALVIKGKGNKERVVFLTDEIIAVIGKYMPVRDAKNKGFDNLFLSNQGAPMQEERISKTLKLVAKKADIPFWEKISPHWLRAACASIKLENGAPVTAVRDLLGHSSIAVTNVYAKSSRNAVKNICMDCGF